MSTEDEVMRVRKELEKITESVNSGGSVDRALDLLRILSETKMNLQILTKTRIGMTVNTLRKSSKDEDVVAKSKALVKAWKKFVPENAGSGPDKDGDKLKKNSSSDKDDDRPKSFPPKPSATTDDVRLSCRKLLASALKGDGEFLEGTVSNSEDLAEIIEDTIYQKYKQTNAKYKTQIRSRVFNLKDKKNQSLRENVLCGVIKPERLAVMTSEDMASEEVKRQRESFIKQGIDAAQLAKSQGTKTDLLKCGKCQKNNCTYNQLQTRSADEPMTTFVLCNSCGNRWKFG